MRDFEKVVDRELDRGYRKKEGDPITFVRLSFCMPKQKYRYVDGSNLFAPTSMEIRIMEQITSQCTIHILSSLIFTSFHANIQTKPNKANIRHSPYTSIISNTHTHTLYSTTKQTARNPCCNHHITTNHHNNCAREYCPYQQQQYIYIKQQ